MRLMRKPSPWFGPRLLGSGKLELPWARTHRANRRSLAANCALCAGVGNLGFWPSTLAHERWAAWKAGLDGLTSLPGWSLSEISPRLLGSGKSGTPWARMHTAYCSAAACKVVGLPAPEPDDPLEHAAARTPRATVVAPITANRTPALERYDRSLLM